MDYETTVSTSADAAAVWDAFVDVERWPDLTPSMREVRRLDQGPFTVGSRARIRQPRIPPAVWEVTALDPGRSFTWGSRSPGLTTVAEHEVGPGTGGTQVVLRLRLSGALAGVARAVYGRRIRRFLDLEARGMVRAAEGAAVQSS